MRATLATLGLAALAAANPMPQAVTSAITPKTTAPAGCQASYPGTFEIQVVNVTSSSKVKRDTVLMLTLANGILTDAYGRTGYIAANQQFQFDGPPQAGAIYTAGWSVCPNGTLALGGETSFFQCLSGTFYNLYDQSTGAQCSPVYIEVINGGGSTTSVVSQYTDGQPQETPVPTPICQYTDGQPQETACAPVSEYTDGQPQAPTGTPVSEYTDGQPQAPTGTPVSEYTDGQPQAPTGTPVSEYTDGQPQAPTGTPVSEYTDGQPQAPTQAPTPVCQYTDGQPQETACAPVSEYTDGQPQAPTGTPVSEYTDGQPQAPTATPVTQISDGQIQATTGVSTPTSPAYQNAAPAVTQGAMGIAAAVLAVLAL